MLKPALLKKGLRRWAPLGPYGRVVIWLKPALLKKGLLRGEILSGHPEGAKAPEGSPSILGGCLAIAR
jgi:hypothetical protein